jgi:hypothetical protein
VPYDKVLAIFHYFSTSSGFPCNLTAEPGTGGSLIVAFDDNRALRSVRRIYGVACLHHWHARRVAFGFTRGAMQPRGALRPDQRPDGDLDGAGVYQHGPPDHAGGADRMIKTAVKPTTSTVEPAST